MRELDGAARVVALLESLEDVLPAGAVAAWDRTGSSPAPASIALELDRAYRAGSYAELLESLRRMRAAELELWRHTLGRYVWGERRVLEVAVARGRWGSRPIVPPGYELVGGAPAIGGRSARVIVRPWAPGTSAELADRGVAWLVGDMYGGRADRIVLPAELLEAGG